MKRTGLVVCLVAAGVFANPRPASAGFWAWLEQFSGPGPFTTGKKAPFLLTYCFYKQTVPDSADSSATRARTVFGPSPAVSEKNQGPVRCIYFDNASFTAPAEPVSEGGRGFPEIEARLTDYGGTLRIVDGLDIGAGVGRISFKVGEESFAKLTITPIRVVTRPLLLAIPPSVINHEWGRQALGVFSIYWKETFVEGELTGPQFGAKDSTFKTNGDLVRSWGITLDLTAALPPKWTSLRGR